MSIVNWAERKSPIQRQLFAEVTDRRFGQIPHRQLRLPSLASGLEHTAEPLFSLFVTLATQVSQVWPIGYYHCSAYRVRRPSAPSLDMRNGEHSPHPPAEPATPSTS